MELAEDLVTWVAIGAALGAVVALLLALLSILGQRRVRRAYRVFSRESSEDVLTLLQRYIGEVTALREKVAHIDERADHLRDLIAGAVTRVATVRYDAFDDMGGHMSYSTALLDEHGNGVVLTSIHGRADTRTYAKPIVDGQSKHHLSEEETSVISEALAADGPTPPAAEREERSASTP